MTDRIPPHDMQAEAAVLAAALLDREAADALTDLQPEHFYSEAHARIWEAISSLRAASQPCDIVTVKGWLKSHGRYEQVGGREYLMQVMDGSPAVANVRSHASIVMARWVARKSLTALHKAVAELYEGVEDESAYVASVADTLGELSRGRSPETMLPVRDHLQTLFAQLQAANSGAPTGRVMTGWSDLDSTLSGLWPGEQTIVAGRPAMGKSAFGFQIGLEVASAGIGVAGFSLEMPGPLVSGRILAARSGVPASALRAGPLTPQDFSLTIKSMSDVSPLPFWLDDMPGPTVQTIAAKCRMLRRALERDGKRLGLVIVDYLQLADTGRRHDTREGEVSEISRGLKRLARELSCAVLALSQLNRGVEARTDKRPMLSDLRESGAIEQDADNVLMLYRDEYYNKSASKLPGIAEIIVAKQRNGSTGTVYLGWDGPTTSFRDMSPSQRDIVESCRPRNPNGD